jgi:DUF4097 and DUF4098 domain-containing protein YvlB
MRHETLITTFLALAVASTTFAQREERFSRTLDVGDHGELELSNISGDVRVEGTSGSQIVIEAVKRAEGRAEVGDVDIEVSQTGDRIRVETRHNHGGRGRNGGVSVDYKVLVPKGTEVSLESVSGNVTLSAVDGEVSVKSVSGDVEVSDAASLSKAESVSGDVEVRGARSSRTIEISSVSGDVEGENIEADELNVSSVSGDVRLDAVASDRASFESVSGNIRYGGRISRGGRYEFQSHSGNVVIAIGDEVGFQLQASTFSGDIDSELPLKSVSRTHKGRNLEGVVGDGSAFIEATTFSGNVEIRKR